MYLLEGPSIALFPLVLLPFLIECGFLLAKSQSFDPVAMELRELKIKIKDLQRKIKGLSDIDDFVEKKKLERELLSTEKQCDEKKKYFDYGIAMYDARWSRVKFLYSIAQFALVLVLRIGTKTPVVQFEGFSTFPLGIFVSFPFFISGLVGPIILTSCGRATANIIFPVKVTY